MQYNSQHYECYCNFFFKSRFSREEYCCFYGPGIPVYYEPLLFYKKCTKIIYKNINTNNITPTSIVKWNSFLLLKGDAEITSQDVFKLCFKLTTDSTIQWFQRRILHRILPVRNYFKKIKVIDSFTFCGNDTKTTLYLTYFCNIYFYIGFVESVQHSYL